MFIRVIIFNPFSINRILYRDRKIVEYNTEIANYYTILGPLNFYGESQLTRKVFQKTWRELYNDFITYTRENTQPHKTIHNQITHSGDNKDFGVLVDNILYYKSIVNNTN